jgi:hypothetical protein
MSKHCPREAKTGNACAYRSGWMILLLFRVQLNVFVYKLLTNLPVGMQVNAL